MIAYYENRKNDFSAADRTNFKSRLACSAHLHYHIELVLLKKGNTVAFADAERETLSDGDAFISFPNQIHRYESSGPESYYLFIINPSLMPALTELFAEKLPRKNVIKNVASDPVILQLFDRLLEMKKPADAFEEIERQGVLLTLFSLLLRRMELLDAPSGEAHPLKAIISYCMQNYQSELSLSVLEEKLHISRYYISHLFSDKLHIHFNDYVNSLRISFACHYLCSSKRPVTEIASLVGFTTPRTFNRAFAKQMGTTPSEYRRRAAKPT